MTVVPPGCGSQLQDTSKHHVPGENLAYLCLGSEAGEVEEHAI